MAKETRLFSTSLRSLAFKILKATIKGVLFYALFVVLWKLLAPYTATVPILQQSVETFIAVYIVLMVVGDSVKGTVCHYFFNVAKAFFVIFYLMASLNGGIIGMAFENVQLLVDLRLFLVAAMILGLIGLAKSVLQTIDFMAEKAERLQENPLILD